MNQASPYRRSLARERRPTKATIRGPLKLHVAEEIEVGDRVCETNLTVYCLTRKKKLLEVG